MFLTERKISRKKKRRELTVSWQKNSCQRFFTMKKSWIQIGFQLSGTFSIWLRHWGLQNFNKTNILLWLQQFFFCVFFLASWLSLQGDNKMKLCKYASTLFERTELTAALTVSPGNEASRWSNKCLDRYATQTSNVSHVCRYLTLVSRSKAAFMDWAFTPWHKSG